MSATSRNQESTSFNINPPLHPQRRSKPPNRNQVFEISQVTHDPATNGGGTVSVGFRPPDSREASSRQSMQGNASPPRASLTKYKAAAEETVGHLIWTQAVGGSGVSAQQPANVAHKRTESQSYPHMPDAQQRDRGAGGVADTMGSISVIQNVSANNSWNEASFSPPTQRKEKFPLSIKGSGGPLVKQAKLGFSFGSILALLQAGLIVLYAIFVRYDAEQVASDPPRSPATGTVSYVDFLDAHNSDNTRLHDYSPLFQDVHVMIFVGFGFLMTFLRKYGYSALGYNMLIGALAIQWSILCRGFLHHGFGTNGINITSLINGDFAAGAVLITFGAVIGVASPQQLIFVCAVEVALYCVNEYIGAEIFKAIDIGGSMFIHTFGAYFGLAMSWAMRRQSDIDTKNEGASYSSDMFAMIGTLFLWMFWPSFNGALAAGDDQHRAVLNTVLSLTASCIFSFAASSLMSPGNKFSMVHVQNASLAGGVAVGAVADLMIQPYGALLIGSIAGLLSTAGYVYLTPLLQRTIGLHDTCGVHNLHGMPGVMAGLAGVVMAAIANERDYGKSLYLQYPARAPLENSSHLSEIHNDYLVSVEAGLDRSAETQAYFQLAALAVTLGIALVGGAVTGLLLRIPFFNKVPDEHLFSDSQHWELEEEGGDDHSTSTGHQLGNQTTNGSYGTLGVTNQGMEMRNEKGVAEREM